MERKLRELRQAVLVGGVVVMLLTAGGVAAVETQTASVTTNQTTGGVNTVAIDENVSVWDRAALPFRAKAGNAPTQVQNLNAFVNIESANTGNVPLNKDTLAVHKQGEKITLKLDSGTTGAGTGSFDQEDVQLVVAHLDENTDSISGDTESPSQPIQRAFDLLSVENANENVTFTVLDNESGVGSTEASGDFTTTFTPKKSGQYALFLAIPDSGNGFTATDGDLSVDGDVTVIGMDEVVVQKTSAKVTKPNWKNSFEVGDDVYFETESNLQGENNVSHVMVLYDDSTFINSEATLSVSGELDRNLSAENITLKHSIESVNGVARIRDEDFTTNDNLGGTIFGVDFGDGHVAREISLGGAIDFVATKTNTTVPETKSTGDAVLDASTTVVVTASSEQKTGLRVGTLKNWSAGEYRWVYVAVGEKDTELSTNTGTVTLTKPDDTPDNNDPGTNPGNDPDTSPNTDPSDGPTQPSSVDVNVDNPSTDEVRASIQNAKANQPVSIDLPETSSSDTVGGLEQIALTPTVGGEFQLGVATDETVPSGTPTLSASHTANSMLYFNVTHSISDADIDEVNFTFNVQKSRLDTAPENVAFYRYHDGSWNALETTLVGETNETYRFKARSPGLSVFAMAVEQPSFTVAKVELSDTTITAGESARVTATIKNDGQASGTFTAELTIDGDFVAERSVTVPAGETRQVSFVRTFDDPGSYEISLSGSDGGTLSVKQDSATTTTTVSTTPGTSTTPGDDGDGGFGLGAIGLLVLVLLALAAGVVYFVRQRDEF